MRNTAPLHRLRQKANKKGSAVMCKTCGKAHKAGTPHFGGKSPNMRKHKTVNVKFQPGKYEEKEEVKAIRALGEMHQGMKGKRRKSLLSRMKKYKRGSGKAFKLFKNSRREKAAFPRAPKPRGRGIVKALGQKKTTGHFAQIAASKGKGAAIAALQNKLAKHRGRPAPFHRKK